MTISEEQTDIEEKNRRAELKKRKVVDDVMYDIDKTNKKFDDEVDKNFCQLHEPEVPAFMQPNKPQPQISEESSGNTNEISTDEDMLK